MTNETLVLAIQAGQNVTENMEQLYDQNRGMIYKLTEKYRGVTELEDLRQEAFFGLARAVQMWSPERESQFITYAVICIKTQIHRYVTDCGALIRVPEPQKALIYRYKKIVHSFRVELGRDPKPMELRVLLEISKGQLEQLIKDTAVLRIRSTSEPIGGEDDDITLEDALPAEGDQYEEVLDRIQQEQLSRELWAQVDKLPEKEAAVIRGKYQRGQTYSQCGEELGVSTERIRQLNERALRALRNRKVTKHLIPYLSDSAAYSIGTHGGLSSFRHQHTTAQERAVMMLEERTGPIWQNVTIKEEQA